jgi:hypothetical protein
MGKIGADALSLTKTMPDTPMEAIVRTYTGKEPTPAQRAFAANQLPALADAIHAYTSSIPLKSARPISFREIQAVVTGNIPMPLPAIAMAIAVLRGDGRLMAQVVNVPPGPEVHRETRSAAKQH